MARDLTTERTCEVCSGPIRDVPHQDTPNARACSPHCAGILFKREHPEHGRWPRESLS